MEKDHGVRFTDEFYATKDDVKKALNMSNIDSIWNKVNLYRSYYTKQTGLSNIERVPFNVVLPPRLTNQIVSIEKKLSKALIKYSKDYYQNPRVVRIFENDQYLKILNVLKEVYEIQIGEDTLKAIVEETLPSVPVEYLVLSNYYKTLRYFKTRSSGQFNLSLIMMMYTKLRGIDLDVTSLEDYYRKTEFIDKADHVFIGRHYEAAPVDRIPDLMNKLFEFNNNSSLFGVVKSFITFFYINYVKPFEYFNEEMAVLMSKYCLAHFDNEDIASFLPIEELLYSHYDEILRKMSFESEMKLDFTYIVKTLVEYLEQWVDELVEDLSIFDSKMMYQELHQEDTIKEPIRKQDPVPSTPYVKKEVVQETATPSINFERKVALPTMPVGLDENDAELVAQHLLELYPTLKKGQAEFYSRHCTLGKYYTIGMYKKENDCAYETARTSMDNLASLGFYKKENIRNKFVYTPNPLNRED